MLGPSFGGFPMMIGSAKPGPRLTVTNNGVGTATLTMQGYVHHDGSGSTEWWADTSRSNLVSGTPAVTNTDDFDKTTITLTINDASQPYYFQYVAKDASTNIIARSNIYGPITITGDTEAAALITILKGTDGWAGNAAQEAAIHNWFADNRADGLFSYMGDVVFPLFSAASPNGRTWINRTAGTYNGGAGTSHNADGVSFSGSYFDIGATPSGLGMTYNSNGMFVIRKNTPSGAVTECGDNDGSGEINLWLDISSLTLHRMGDASGGAFVGTPISTNGLFVQSRYSASDAIAKNYDWADTVLGSSSTLSGTAFPASGNIFFGAVNNGGSAAGNTSEYYHGFGAIKGMNETQLDLFAINTEALLTAFGITL